MPRLLLDEMLSDVIAATLRERHLDVESISATAGLVGIPDDEVLAYAAASDRAVVTRNIKDFAALDAEYRRETRRHAGLVFVSTRTFPEDRSAIGAVTRALETILATGQDLSNSVIFLERQPA